MMSNREKGILSLILLTFVWAFASLLPRYLSTAFPLFQQMYLRFLAGTITMAIIFRKRINYKKILSAPKSKILRLFARGGVYYLLGVSLWTQALLLTKISNVAFIGTIPMTAILGFVILKEKLTVPKALLIALSFVGVLSISLKGSFQLSFGLGELLAICSSVFIALGMIMRKWEDDYFNTFEASLLVIFFAFFLELMASLVTGEGLPVSGWNLGISAVLVFSAFLNVGVVMLITYGFRRVKAVLANNILNFEAVLTVFLAWIFYHEFPVAREFLGGGLIVLSAFLLNKLESKD